MVSTLFMNIAPARYERRSLPDWLKDDLFFSIKTFVIGCLTIPFFTTSRAASTTPLHNIPAPSSNYYWVVPEQSLTAIITQNNDQELPYFLERDSYSLADVETLALTYPQTIQAILLDSTTSIIACARAWFQPLHNTGQCGQPAGYFRNMLFWDSSRLTTPPHWADLWDVARYPGQRTFFKGPRITLEIALLADGVPPSHIYRQLSTSQGIDRAFRKLDQLRPYIIWWSSASQAYHILNRRSVLMGVAPSAVILASQSLQDSGRRYQIQGNNILYLPAVWDIPSTLSPEKTNETKAILLTDPPHIANLPAHLPTESLEISESFWASNALLLGARFDAWLANTPSPLP